MSHCAEWVRQACSSIHPTNPMSAEFGPAELHYRSLDPELQHKLDKVELITFDLDDTLWPLKATLMAAEEKQYAWLCEHAGRITADLSVHDILEKRKQFLQSHPELRGDVTQMRKQSLHDLFRSYDYDEDRSAEMVGSVYAEFYLARSQVTLFEGALECLDTLRQKYKLAALTNGNADLEIAGIAHLFDDARFATQETPAKPDPTMFLQCANCLNVEPQHCLHVGDSIETDITGAQRAGALSAWFNPAGTDWPEEFARQDRPTVTLSSLQNLLDLMPALQV